MPLLEVNDVHAYYGNIHALKGVSLTVEKGEIVTLIGGNGAGKTTTLRTITGLMRPRDGRVMFDGEEVAKLPAHDWVSRGIAMVPEGRGVFARLTVEENLEMGAYHRKDKAGIKADIEKSYQMFPRLGERRTQLAGTMSGGEQQMLAVTRALMSKPRLLLMDEPSMGLAPVLVDVIFEAIETINQEGMTILLVEQNAHMALQVANRGYVLQTGQIVLTDKAAVLQKDPTVQKAYLGIE
ncbi:MAG: ABC transporter ATP-binding protein [Anaerolineae bacterium]|jgi:branched-chain amino acid transport system ATP-binding protein|nr:ABC transporter ATP-binding protein [Anaerolineae bacterium]